MKFLLDTNVIKELGKPTAHENVAAWFDSVNDSDLAISAISVREISKGIEKKRVSDPELAATLQAAADKIFAAYAGRILPVDEPVARRWGQLLAESDQHVNDTGMAATALVHGLTVASRNEDDFEKRGVPLINPFKKQPKPSKV